ncbi:DUF348 domain-containing protein, partial [bacterium]
MSRKKIYVFLAIGVIVAAALILFLGSRERVTFVIDGKAQSAQVRALTVGGALRAAGIALDERDVLQPQKSALLKANQAIEITQARAVNIQVLPGGETSLLISAGSTAGDLLAEADVALGADDRIWANGERVTAQQELAPGTELALVVRRAQTIELHSGEETQQLTSSAATLGEALSEAGILLAPADRLSPAVETPLDGAMEVELRRAVELTIQVDGGVVRAKSAAETIGEALAEAGVSLQGLDYSLPAEGKGIPADGSLRVVRVREELVIQQTAVPYTTKYENSDQGELDQQQGVVAGVLGIQEWRGRVRYEAGQ